MAVKGLSYIQCTRTSNILSENEWPEHLLFKVYCVVVLVLIMILNNVGVVCGCDRWMHVWVMCIKIMSELLITDQIKFKKTLKNSFIPFLQVLSNNETFRRMVLQTVNVYYHITHKVTKSTYNKLVQHFKEEPVPIPTLFFYAENDPVCDTKALEDMINEWRSKKPGFEVTVVSWPKSIHAAHLKEHREEYVEALQGLLKRLELL